MDTNKMHDEFEAAFVAKYGFGRLTASANADAHAIYEAAKWAWHASREAVAMELPEALSSAALDEVEVAEVLLAGQGLSNLAGAIGCAYLICKDLPSIRSAIEAQGLKVTP